MSLCLSVTAVCVSACVSTVVQLTIERDKLNEAQRLIRESEAKVGVLLHVALMLSGRMDPTHSTWDLSVLHLQFSVTSDDMYTIICNGM